jgi:hypothetical protein
MTRSVAWTLARVWNADVALADRTEEGARLQDLATIEARVRAILPGVQEPFRCAGISRPQQAVAASTFSAILNEKDPDPPKVRISPPKPLRGRIVSDEVLTLRSHLDVRIARRAQTVAKLAQVISERDIQKDGGLRRVLLVQS